MDFFKDLTQAPGDPILAIMGLYQADTNPNKVDLSVGVYFNDQGKTVNFDAIDKAQKIVSQYLYSLPKDFDLAQADTSLANLAPKGLTTAYLPASGFPSYCELVKELVFGENNQAVKENRVQTLASVAGSGGLTLASGLARKIGFERVFISNPSWSNYYALFGKDGFAIKEFSYYNKETNSLDFEACLADLQQLTAKDVILLQGSCHNPSGFDFTQEQWEQVINLIAQKGALALFDFAYQGFGRGVDEDAFAIRYSTQVLKNFLVVSSCSKNFGLYGERVGAVHVVAEDPQGAYLAWTNLRDLANNYYVAAGSNGEYLVATILSNPELKAQWLSELNAVNTRINNLRKQFAENMKQRGFDFDFVMKQNGMFSYTGLTAKQVEVLKDKYSIYMIGNGRMNVVGLNDNNMQYVTDAFADVLKNY